MLYAMVVGRLPFGVRGQAPDEIIEAISQRPVDLSPAVPMSVQFVSLLLRLLTKNPEERVTLSEVLSHRWLILSDGATASGGDDPLFFRNILHALKQGVSSGVSRCWRQAPPQPHAQPSTHAHEEGEFAGPSAPAETVFTVRTPRSQTRNIRNKLRQVRSRGVRPGGYGDSNSPEVTRSGARAGPPSPAANPPASRSHTHARHRPPSPSPPAVSPAAEILLRGTVEVDDHVQQSLQSRRRTRSGGSAALPRARLPHTQLRSMWPSTPASRAAVNPRPSSPPAASSRSPAAPSGDQVDLSSPSTSAVPAASSSCALASKDDPAGQVEVRTRRRSNSYSGMQHRRVHYVSLAEEEERESAAARQLLTSPVSSISQFLPSKIQQQRKQSSLHSTAHTPLTPRLDVPADEFSPRRSF
jgi:hypothetical protein